MENVRLSIKCMHDPFLNLKWHKSYDNVFVQTCAKMYQSWYSYSKLSFISYHINIFSMHFCKKKNTVAVFFLAGLTASVATGCSAALLPPWTLTIMIAVLCTHGCPLRRSTVTPLHCVWFNAFMSTSIVAALLFIGTVTVIRAELCTHSSAPLPAWTGTRLTWKIAFVFCSKSDVRKGN